MYSFVKRPGFGSKELLIEFRKGAGTDEMFSALKEAISAIGAKLAKKEDVWVNDEILYHMKSNAGKFLISSGAYDSVIILPDGNQQAIEAIETALLNSGKFEKEEVDFADYR